MSRLSQAHLQAYYRVYSNLIAALVDARRRYRLDIPGGRRGMRGHSQFVKALMSLSHTQDYSIFEYQLKRRLVRMGHRVWGHKDLAGKGIAYHLPNVYAEQVEEYRQEWASLMRRLADVDIKNQHQHLTTVDAILQEYRLQCVE